MSTIHLFTRYIDYEIWFNSLYIWWKSANINCTHLGYIVLSTCFVRNLYTKNTVVIPRYIYGGNNMVRCYKSKNNSNVYIFFLFIFDVSLSDYFTYK